MKDNKQCNICAKQFLCKECTGLVKFSQTKNYGEVKKMLKIKDDVNLKELEKHHILEFIDLTTREFTQYVGYVLDENGENKYVLETDENKIIQTWIYKEGLDILYDLIQAGLVEKVEE